MSEYKKPAGTGCLGMVSFLASFILLVFLGGVNIANASTLFQLTKDQVSGGNVNWSPLDENYYNGNRGFVWRTDTVSGSFDRVCLYLGNHNSASFLEEGYINLYARESWPNEGSNTWIATSELLDADIPLIPSLYSAEGFKLNCFKFSTPITVSPGEYYAFALQLNGSAIALLGGVSVYPRANVVTSGNISYTYVWVGAAPPFSLLDGDSFYAHIKSSVNGKRNLYSSTSTSSGILKTLPEDWVVRVASTTDHLGNKITADGYSWYKVTDPTDNVEGWMQSENASSTDQYLVFSDDQSQAVSVSANYVATSSRPAIILDAINHYFNGTSTDYSLYSSDDGTNNISDLKTKGFEEKVIWGIAAQESGPYGFNNEIVSFDYGHGIMQLTFNAWSHEPGNLTGTTWDNRGIGSRIDVIPCASIGTSDYVDCYTEAGIAATNIKRYKPYVGNPSNPTYKQYVNTEQSIFANIKDGMRVLQDKYSGINISTSTTIDGNTFSADEREIIQVTERYNGACGYVDDVAGKLDHIDDYFPTATSSDISGLIEKMHIAGTDLICAQLHSPAEIVIEDGEGNATGVAKGRGVNTFPMAVYDKEQKFAKVFFPGDRKYSYRVVGTDDGDYGLDIIVKNLDSEVSFIAKRIPIVRGEVHIYQIDKQALMRGERGVTLSIDKNGDGVPERVLQVSRDLNKSELNSDQYIIKENLPVVIPGDVVTDDISDKEKDIELEVPAPIDVDTTEIESPVPVED